MIAGAPPMGRAVLQSEPYTFRDKQDSAFLEIVVPDGSKADDFSVRSTIDTLKVTDRRSGTVLIDIVQLAGQVDAKATTTAINGSTLCLTLYKLHKGSWAGLEPEQLDCTKAQQGSQTQASGALSERERVKSLLAAAQQDGPEALRNASAHFVGTDIAQVRDANGMTAVHFAAQQGRLPNLQYLIEELQSQPDPRSEAGEQCKEPPEG